MICKNCHRDKKEHIRRFAPNEDKPWCNIWDNDQRLEFALQNQDALVSSEVNQHE
jgi:hypothetical protein